LHVTFTLTATEVLVHPVTLFASFTLYVPAELTTNVLFVAPGMLELFFIHWLGILFAVFAVRAAICPWQMLIGPVRVTLGFGVGLDVTEILLDVA
jgi:hypothetical protein